MLTVVFDFDGTLADTEPLLRRVSLERATAWGIVGFDIERFLAVMHHPTSVDFGWSWSRARQEQFCSDVFATLDRLMAGDEACLPAIFPWCRLLLPALRGAGMTLAIVTSRPARSLHAVLERHGLAEHFAACVTNDDVLAGTVRAKPAPDPLLHAMAWLGASRDRTLMIGDTLADVRMAVAAEVEVAAVDWGFEADGGRLVAAGARVLLGMHDDHARVIRSLLMDAPEREGTRT